MLRCTIAFVELAIFCGITSYSALLLNRARQNRDPKRWQNIADDFGLSLHSYETQFMQGESEGLDVRVNRSFEENLPLFEVQVHNPKIPARLVMGPAKIGHQIENNIGQEYFVAEGDRAASLALFALTPNAVEAVGQLVLGHQAQIQNSRVCIRLPERSPLRLRRAIRGALCIARALQLSASQIEERLARAVQQNNIDVALRIRCLEALVLERPRSPHTRAALADAETSPDPKLIVAAAKLQKPPPAPLLRKLNSIYIPEQLRVEVTRLIGLHLHREEAVSLLMPLLLGPHPTSVRQAALERLIALNAPQLEPALISVLRTPAPELQKMAVRWLGCWGSVRAVNPMLESIKGLFVNTELKFVTRRAVHRIQSRLVQGDMGQLSVVPAERERRGALSLGSKPGELSLMEFR